MTGSGRPLAAVPAARADGQRHQPGAAEYAATGHAVRVTTWPATDTGGALDRVTQHLGAADVRLALLREAVEAADSGVDGPLTRVPEGEAIDLVVRERTESECPRYRRPGSRQPDRRGMVGGRAAGRPGWGEGGNGSAGAAAGRS